MQVRLYEAFKRMPSIRRFIGSRLVYTPLMAIVIFLVVMAIILGTLQVQERQQQEGSLFRELSLVKQRIQLRLSTIVKPCNPLVVISPKPKTIV